MATQKQVNDFINMIAPIAIEICNATSKKVLPSVCIAQACCESAYGTSPKMIRANAVLGVKVGKNKVHFGNAWKDKAYSTKTKECYDGKTYVEITDMFRAYDTIRDSVQDYYDMLGVCSRYAGCINEKDYVKSITAIKNGGYATSPTYISTITSIIKKYNLTQYDICMVGRKTEYYPIPEFTLVDSLNKIGVNSTLANRKIIAERNNIEDYRGTAQQNLKMLELLNNGKLIKP